MKHLKNIAWAHKAFACIGNSPLNKLTPAGFVAEPLVSQQMYLKVEILSVQELAAISHYCFQLWL